MAKSFEETVLTLLGKINARLNRIEERLDGIDVRLDNIDVRLDNIEKRLNGHDEMFTKIIEGIAPEMEIRTLHTMKLKDHERRIRHLEAS